MLLCPAPNLRSVRPKWLHRPVSIFSISCPQSSLCPATAALPAGSWPRHRWALCPGGSWWPASLSAPGLRLLLCSFYFSDYIQMGEWKLGACIMRGSTFFRHSSSKQQNIYLKIRAGYFGAFDCISFFFFFDTESILPKIWQKLLNVLCTGLIYHTGALNYLAFIQTWPLQIWFHFCFINLISSFSIYA